ncbi:MAG TPA: acyltransferase family protein, partial [Burkholderiaceae bacterium]|nr:acyltransferase family protein [Burkholderiaceae bacterium]
MGVQRDHRADIDGLRGFAVLGVLAFDASARWLPGGFVGIDVLFVVSGYLISTTVLPDLERGSFDFPAYCLRRARRLWPALLLVLLVVLVAGGFLMFAGEYRRLGAEVAAGAVFASNFIARETPPGMDARVLQHLWCLALLAQFSLAWPLLLMGARGNARRAEQIAVTLLVLSFGIDLFWSYRDPADALYSPLARLWEFALGGYLALLQRRGRKLEAPPANTAAMTGCLLLAVSVVVLSNGRPFPGWRALAPALGAFLVLAAGPEAWLNRKLFGNWAAVGVGRVSYPLYLWHWPLLAFTGIFASTLPSANLRIATIGIALLAAVATHLLVERPIRRGPRAAVTTPLLLGLVAAVGVAGAACMALNGLPGAGFRDPAREAFLASFDADETPIGCTERCTERDPAKRHAVMLWGDTHASELYAGLRKNLPADWQILQVGPSNCPPDGLVSGPSSDPCLQAGWEALQTIAALHPDVVVLAQGAGHFAWRMEATADKLAKLGVARTLAVGPTPHWVTGLPTIVARHLWHDTPRRTLIGIDRPIAL